MGKTFEHNSDVIPNANDTVEILFNQEGTDVVTGTAMQWYYGLEKPAKKIVVKVDAISQITEVNNVVLKSPINIAANSSDATDVAWGFNHKFIQITVKLLNATTNLEVRGIC